LAQLFRDRTECSTLDVELSLLAGFWKDLADKDKRNLADQLKETGIKEFGEIES
jgi:hypothetical protein